MIRRVRIGTGLIAVAIMTLNFEPKQNGQLPPAFWSDLGAGPYSVGFRVLYRQDQRRKWFKRPAEALSDPGRPIRISIWYPAVRPPSGEPMKYGDYLHHEGPQEFRSLDEQLDKSDVESWVSDLQEISPPGQAMFQKVRSTAVAAYRDASPARGQFPLVLYSGGKASRADANVELGEYLASHGYVVATVPQLGPSDQELELGSSPQEISLHADDFDAAITALHDLREIDFNHIATAGHSAGGEVAVELALRHPAITAVIGLDASYGTTGGSRVLKQLPEYSVARPLVAALLDLRRAQGSQGVKLDLTPIDALHWLHVYRILFAKAFHGDFTEWGMVAIKVSIPMPPNPDKHTRRIGYEVNRRTCHIVLDFLDARLRGRKDALDRLKGAVQKAGSASQ